MKGIPGKQRKEWKPESKGRWVLRVSRKIKASTQWLDSYSNVSWGLERWVHQVRTLVFL